MGCSSNNIIFIENISYEKIKKLGEGATCKVMKLKNGDKFFALKIFDTKGLKKEEKDKFYNEIDILKSFDSKYIVKFSDSYEDEDNNKLNILMEFGGDDNLKTFINKYKTNHHLIDEKEIAKIFSQICQGLEVIHDSKIIHRDFTPQNIFIDENNNIKIGDFGVSTRNNFSTEIVGKTEYIAPEMLKQKKYDYRIDIYALGCILYELFKLNDYHHDKKYENNNTIINLEIYKKKWQYLIELLLQDNYFSRPSLKEIKHYINICKKKEKNEIILRVEITENDLHKKIYYFTENKDYLDEINNTNVNIEINGKKNEFLRYFKPTNKGIITIKITINLSIKNCRYMFYNCKKIKSIDLSSFDSKNVEDMSNMFFYCQNLENIDFFSFDTKNVKDMSNMFFGCTNLKNINLSSFNVENVINMANMFDGCENLEIIDLSSFKNKKVTNMAFMFHYCTSLKNIVLFSFKNSKVTNMCGMFEECNNLESIDLSSINTKNVTDMGYMFNNCYNLKSLNLSSFDTKNVINMNYMFSNCSHLKDVKKSSSFRIKKDICKEGIFNKCKFLEKIFH